MFLFVIFLSVKLRNYLGKQLLCYNTNKNNEDNSPLNKPSKTNARILEFSIVVSTMAIFTVLLMLLGACGPQSETQSPMQTQTEPAMTPAPAATPEPIPISTTPPEETPIPAQTPQPTPIAAVIGKAVCTADESVNIREKADKSSAVLGALPAGETVDVIAYEDGWARIHHNGTDGYVNRDYLIGRRTPQIQVPEGDWAAVLVNPAHPLPDSFETAVTDFEGGQVDTRIYDICAEMFADAAEDGVKFKLVDAYRSFERQNELYQKKVDSYLAKGYNREDAETQAATITARPNTSEHQTGLALDIVTPSYTKRDKGFANTDAFKWLNANAQDYGFTLRYKKGKQDLTGVIYEPWHWRFVGMEAAREMKQSGECLEEYFKAGE